MNQVYNLVKVATTKQSKLLRKGFAVFAVLALTVQLVLPAVTVKAVANWDTTGSYVFRFEYNGSNYDHNVSLAQDSSGNLSGSGSHAPYTWTITSGTVVGDIITFSANYTATADAVTPLTTMQVTGTVASGGSMSGTWTDNYQGGSRRGTWETISGSAELPSTTIVVTGDTALGENQPGWMFNRDAGNVTPFGFNAGNPSIGSGALEVYPIGTNASDKMIAENFIHRTIGDIESISFDFKLGAGNEGRQSQVYLNAYMNFPTSDPNKFYDCRYDLVATTGSASGYTTVTFDPTTVTVLGKQSGTSPATCPAIPADMGDTANLRMFSLSMGDSSSSDIGMSGYFDNVVVKTVDGNTIYDFEPKPPRIRTNVQIVKKWVDASGQEVDTPSNASDISIKITTQNGNEDICDYDISGEFGCDGTINSYTDETIGVEESGVPAGWTVDSTTVGKEIVPVCDVPEENGQSPIDCTHTVINKQNTPVPCATELVANGGFEVPNVETGGKWDIFESGTAGLGWSAQWLNNVGGAQPDKGQVELHKNGVVSGWTAHGGDQYTELDSDWGGPSSNQGGENASVKLYQDLITKVGGNYTVTFWASPRPGQSSADNSIRVKVGDVDSVINAVTGSSTVWSKYTYTFEATSGVTRLEFSDAGPGNSFGGFLDDVSVKEDCVSDVQICKYNDDQTPLSGWDVFLKGDKIETVTVNPDGQSDLSGPLPAGDYVLEASGTYVYRPGEPTADISDPAFSKRLPSDAVYSIGSSQPWVRVNDFPGAISGYLGIQVGGLNFDWGSTYNPAHKYSGEYTLASAGQMSFRILDDVYSDNSGNLKVDIYPIYKGETGKDGCVTLENIPYSGKGTNYTLGEVMQDGWENVSGNNEEVVVDGIEDSFPLVNKCTGENCVVPCSEFNLGFADGFDVDAVEAVTETCEPPVIEEPCTEISEDVTLASDANTQTAGYTTNNPGDGFGEDPLDPTAYSGSFVNSAIANPVIPPWLDPATHPAYAGSGAQWISSTAQHPGETDGAGSGVDNQWRLFQKKFTVPAGAIVTPGTINFTADNGVTVYLNGHEIGSTPEVPTFGATPSPIPVVFDHSYSVPFIPVAGQENVLEFVVRNSNYSGVNPTGLVYNANYSYRVECDTPPDNCEIEKDDVAPGVKLGLEAVKSIFDEDEEGGDDCYSVSGNVYHDQSNPGTRFNGEDPVDTGIAGMLVYIDLNENDAPDTDEPQTVSLANGDYQIDGLPAGCYTVREDSSSVPGWAQGIQPVDHEYQVGIGGFECNPSDDILKLSFVKTAQAQALDTFPDDAYGLDFGNLPVDRGGNSGGGNPGGGSGSSTTGTTPLVPQVLGDSTTVPSGQVAGASDTLPRTGLPTWALLMVALLAVPAFGLKTLVVKKSSK